MNAFRADGHFDGEPEDIVYSAWDIAPPPRGTKNFSESGDSGAWVFSKEGYLCGMVVGGPNPKLGQGLGKVHGIVVPIDRIFADIELITGSKASLPP